MQHRVTAEARPATEAPGPAAARSAITGFLIVTAACVGLPDGLWVLVLIAVQLVLAARLVPTLDPLVLTLAGTALLLAVPSVLMMIDDRLGGSAATRLSAAVLGAWVMHAHGRTRSGAVVARRPAMAREFAVVAVLGVLIITNSYLLWGPGGPVTLVLNDHVRDAAGFASGLASGPELHAWLQESAPDLRASAGALPWALAVWSVRVIPAAGLDEGHRVVLASGAALVSLALAWLGVVAASIQVEIGEGSRARRSWTVVGLLATLVGPLLWLRFGGAWPPALAASMALLGTAVLGATIRGSGTSSAGRPIAPTGQALWVALPLFALAGLAWPPITAALAGFTIGVGLVLTAAGHRLERRAWVPMLLVPLVSVGLGVLWALRTWPGPPALGSGVTGLGTPDWRLFVLVVVGARLLVLGPGRGRPVAPTYPLMAMAGLALVLVTSGITIDYLSSWLRSGNGTSYASIMGHLGTLTGTAIAVSWLATGDTPHIGWRVRSWRTVAAGWAVAAAAVWTPWGAAIWGGGTVALVPGPYAVVMSAVGEPGAGGPGGLGAGQILRCGWDGVMVTPHEGEQPGDLAASARWMAILADRTDPAGWEATRYVHPGYATTPTVDDQLRWIRLAGPSTPDVALLWVLPDDIALPAASRVASEALPAGVSLRVVGEERFVQELAQCERAADGEGPL